MSRPDAGRKNTGEVIGAALTLPDFNQALAKLNGRLLPFGWITVPRAKRRSTRCACSRSPSRAARWLNTGDQSAHEPRDRRGAARSSAATASTSASFSTSPVSHRHADTPRDAAAPVKIASMELPRRNVELKANDPDPDVSLKVCRALGAEDHGQISQRDTYFDVAHGGLKLREEQPGRPHLIQFERADEPQQRESRYRIIEVDDGTMLSAALAAAIGIRGVVAKRRRLFLWQSVRIHLDTVEQLGTFIELEAVAPADSDLSAEHEVIAELRVVLSITDDRLVGRGYAAQLLGSSR